MPAPARLDLHSEGKVSDYGAPPKRVREHIDQHQVPFAEKMCAAGYAMNVKEMGDLRAAVQTTMGRVRLIQPVSQLSKPCTTWSDGFWTRLRRSERDSAVFDATTFPR